MGTPGGCTQWGFHPSFSRLWLLGLISGGQSSGAVPGIKRKMLSPGQSWFARKAPRKAFCASVADFFVIWQGQLHLWQESMQPLTEILAFCLDWETPAAPPRPQVQWGEWGWSRCQDKPPTPVGFGEVVYVSMLAKLLYYCLYFLPESKYS